MSLPHHEPEDVQAALYDVARRLVPHRASGSLQPTALAHEAWIRLEQSPARWAEVDHVRALLARTMRSVLVDRARARSADKRGGGRVRVSFVPGLLSDRGSGPDEADLLSLDEALADLEREHERAARVVELRFFGGLTLAEVGALLGIGTSTVDDDWRFARAWLHRALSR